MFKLCEALDSNVPDVLDQVSTLMRESVTVWVRVFYLVGVETVETLPIPYLVLGINFNPVNSVQYTLEIHKT
jgi:hypothetical protein